MTTPTNILIEQYGEQLLAPNLTVGTAFEITDEALWRYSEPWRFHHVASHLQDVTGFLIENIDELKHPRTTLWAATGHDGIYIPQAPAGINEELSAQWIEYKLAPFLALKEVDLIGKYVRRAADHEWDGQDIDLALFLDADMKILGTPAAEFDEYDNNIRREYSFVDPELYKKARAGILRGFHAKKRLFITDIAHEQFEDQAKANLERKIDELLAA